MNIQTHILLASNQLTQFQETIKTLSSEAIQKTTQYIPIDNVDIIFYASSIGIIDDLGFGGRCLTKNVIMIPINSSFLNLKQSLENNLKRTMAHELYHCVRNYSYGEKRTLLHSLVDEGLADHFDIEVNQTFPQRWDTALTEEQSTQYMELARKEFNSPTYDHRAWFFGSKEKQIPRWTGYTLGFKLVDTYLKKHPEKKPSHLYKTDINVLL